jgi:multidrug efflux system membrane fusion protein
MNQDTLSPLSPPETGRPSGTRGKSRRWVWLILAIALCAAAYFLWPRIKLSLPANAPPAAAGHKGKGFGTIPVVSAKAQKGTIGVYLTGLGAVTPLQTVTIKSRVDGQLMKINYTEGQIVHAGDALLEIDPRPYQVMLEQAEGQLIKDQAALDNAKIDLARYQKLLAQKAVPEQQYATQVSTVAQDEGAVKTDQANIDNAKLELIYCHITSPIAGRIGLRLVDMGNIVHATDTNGLLVIAQIEPISVIFTIAEDQIPAVRKKMRAGAKLRVEAWDRDLKSKIAQGTLSTIDNQIDQTTGTVKLRALFDNTNDALFPSQFVNARLLLEEKRGVTLVPNAAVQRSSQDTFAYVIQPGNKVTVRTVTTGVVEGDKTEIVSGVEPGEVVVTDGVDKLQEGTTVSTQGDGGKGGRPH